VNAAPLPADPPKLASGHNGHGSNGHVHAAKPTEN
jgi:hypothetical protein